MSKKLTALILCLSLYLTSLVLASCSVEVTKDVKSEDGEVTFDEIEAANTYENLLATYGTYCYTETYGDEPSDSTYYYDGVGQLFCFDNDGDIYAIYKTDSSVYRYQDGVWEAYLDVSGMESTTDVALYAVEFRSDDFNAVEAIEKTDTGYLITFEGNAEDAQFFRDTDYVEGDLFYIREAVHEDLTLDYIEQYIACVDGTTEVLNRTTLVACSLPDFAGDIATRATPSDNDRVTATVTVHPGTEDEWDYSVIFTKNDAFFLEDYGDSVFDDADCTVLHEGGFDTSADIHVYVKSDEEMYVYGDGQLAATEYTEYTEDGEETYFESHRYDPDGNEIESFSYGEKGDNAAYAERYAYDASGEVLSYERTDF